MFSREGKYVWNVMCAVCWKQKKSYEIKRRWDGQLVCADCWEMRHPQDFYRPIPDQHALPFVRNDEAEIDVSPQGPFTCNPLRQRPQAGIGTAGCMTVNSSVVFP